VAEAVVNERTECLARWFSGGSWSDWRPVTSGVRDVSVAALDDDGEPAALVSVVVTVPMELGTARAFYVPGQRAFYRLTAHGVTPASL
jgi:hypothetical protein